jgi:hypothetical protein
MRTLPQLVGLCGGNTQNRKTVCALGRALLQKHPRLFATACPDYFHKNGRYTYDGLGDGVPLLLKLHRDFLAKVCQLVPNIEVTFLIADHEADFAPLCASVGLDRYEFLKRVERSVVASSQALQRRGWKVSTFTDHVPGYMADVNTLTQQLLSDPFLSGRLTAETFARSRFYRKARYPLDVWRTRTAQIAAQYLVLAGYCTSRKIIICNHTTISLAWFQRARVAFLENPIKIH